MHAGVKELMARPQWVQRSPEWFTRRETLMTASDCAGALGIPAFEGQKGGRAVRQALLKQKVGGTFKGNKYTQHGVDHEDDVRDRLAEILGDEALEFGLLVHPDLQWLGASPDGVFAKSGFMIEIKCPVKRQIVPGHVPHHYFPQVQVQMEVADLPATYFCQWQPAEFSATGKEVFDVVVVERDRQWFETHRETLYEFWMDLMAARAAYVPPPPRTSRIRDALYADL